MFTAASTQALHGAQCTVVPSLNLEHLVCLCPKIHGFLRLGNRSGRLDRHIQRDRHARRNAAQNAAVVIGLCHHVTLFVNIERVVVLAAHHFGNLKTCTEFQPLYRGNAEDQLGDGVFQSLKNGRATPAGILIVTHSMMPPEIRRRGWRCECPLSSFHPVHRSAPENPFPALPEYLSWSPWCG